METPRNYDQKCPLVLVLDASGSMSGRPISSLNMALKALKKEILNDSTLSNRLELSIIAFHDIAEVVRDFDLVLPESEMPEIEVGGLTNIVAGMDRAIELIEERKTWYKNSGQPYYRPIVVLFSDGTPTNDDGEINALDEKIQKMSEDKKFLFMPFGVGDGADMDVLAKLAAQTDDQRLKEKAIAYKLKDETKFADIFAFVSASASAAIGGSGTAKVTLDPNIATPHVVDMDLGL